MDEFYYLFSSLYGDELHAFLLGNEGMNDTSQFEVMFFILAIFSAGLIPAFYYKMWDRVTWCSRGKWSIMLLINAVTNFLVSIVWLNLLEEKMVDVDGNALSIDFSNIIGFGLTSAIIASVLFFLASLGWKTQSVNCPNIPL